MLERFKKYRFLFEELVKRDFKKKYKRTILGMMWSLLGPLLQLLVMSLVFTQFFGRDTPHFTIYLFSGMLVYSYFRESTSGGMQSLISNAGIITKVNVPKYLFLMSKNVSSLINFVLTLVIYFVFVALDGIVFQWKFLLLVYPVMCLLIFNIGIGLVLSAMYVFFKDIQYLYDIFTMMLMYLSAIFYTIGSYPDYIQNLFYLNPIFNYILYFRTIVIQNAVPSLLLHALCGLYAFLAILIGAMCYKRYNYRFLYYM